MSKKMKSPLYLLIGGIVLSSIGIVYAINTVGSGFRTTTSNVTIDAHGTCRLVRHSGGTAYFVPTKSSSEWQSFRNNIPGNINTSNCCTYNMANLTHNDTLTGFGFQYARGITFNNNGTKMYIAGDNPDQIKQYSLSTPFDISTATDDGVSVNAQNSNPHNVTFNNNGTKMFEVGYDGKRIYEYNLSTAFNLATASYTGKSLHANVPNGYSFGLGDMSFNSNGTKMFVAAFGFFEYNLSTAYDISTAVRSSNTIADNASILEFNGNGTKLYLESLINPARQMREYTLSSPYNITSVTSSRTISSMNGGVSYGMEFNNDDSSIFKSFGGNTIHEYTVQCQ